MSRKLSFGIVSGLCMGLISLCLGGTQTLAAEWVLQDQLGHKIWQVSSERVRYIGDGLYMCRPFLKRDGHIINRDGKPVSIKLPEGYHFVDIFIPAEKFDCAEGHLPDDALLIIRKNGSTGIINPAGDVKVAAEYENISPLDKHRLVFEKFNPEKRLIDYFIYDLQDKSLVLSRLQPLGAPYYPHPGKEEATEKDRILRHVLKTGFDPVEWTEWKGAGDSGNYSRLDMLAEFFKQYDLMSMKRTEIYKLLGPGQENGNIANYELEWGWRQASGALALKYDSSDRVSGWFTQTVSTKDKDKCNWITENIVLIPVAGNPGYSMKDLKPKQKEMTRIQE